MFHRIRSERMLHDREGDFTATFMAVGHLRSLAHATPPALTPDSLAALETVLRDRRVRGQSQAYFLYREATGALADAVTAGNGLSRPAYHLLKRLLRSTDGPCHRAVSEPLGALPLGIRGPALEAPEKGPIPRIPWNRLWEQLPHTPHGPPRTVGRTVVVPVDAADHVVAVKTASGEESAAGLLYEAAWMVHLQNGEGWDTTAFHIPSPIPLDGGFLVTLSEWPPVLSPLLGPGPECDAICFRTRTDYYRYPNGSEHQSPVSSKVFCSIMGRNAYLLGRLTAQGIIHDALIPLFHNRIQHHRRNDGGRYLWPRAGRLDRWLESCAYPNVGPTGIRDYEHLLPFRGSNRQLYEHIGTHLLSLFLVAGSYFRNKDRSRVGLDAAGRPVDARDLFDPHLLEELIRTIFGKYYEGVVGKPVCDPLPVSVSELAGRMIEEMGVDRHMEEIFRVSDQKDMSDAQFRRFLMDRGTTPEDAAAMTRGAADIALLTGPHLGEFNHRISLPELIHAVETFSASCIADRYWNTRRQHPPLSHAAAA
jgi:hypothetical protein